MPSMSWRGCRAEAGVLNARATLDYARNNYTRMKEARSSNAVSEIDLIQARSNKQIAEAALANAEAALNTAQTNLSYCYVRSPYTGHISLTAYAVGGDISGATCLRISIFLPVRLPCGLLSKIPGEN